MKKKIIFSIVGARPHFVKASPFLDAMKCSTYDVFTIHTGQHYDQNMSDVFFKELNLPKPNINRLVTGVSALSSLAISSLRAAVQNRTFLTNGCTRRNELDLFLLKNK